MHVLDIRQVDGALAALTRLEAAALATSPDFAEIERALVEANAALRAIGDLTLSDWYRVEVEYLRSGSRPWRPGPPQDGFTSREYEEQRAADDRQNLAYRADLARERLLQARSAMEEAVPLVGGQGDDGSIQKLRVAETPTAAPRLLLDSQDECSAITLDGKELRFNDGSNRQLSPRNQEGQLLLALALGRERGPADRSLVWRVNKALAAAGTEVRVAGDKSGRELTGKLCLSSRLRRLAKA